MNQSSKYIVIGGLIGLSGFSPISAHQGINSDVDKEKCEKISLPLSPEFLSQEYLLQSEVPEADKEIHDYLHNVELYQTCLVVRANLNTSNLVLTEEISEVSQKINEMSRLIQQAMEMTLGRYDYLMRNVEYSELSNGS